jgi:hypothetical protein
MAIVDTTLAQIESILLPSVTMLHSRTLCERARDQVVTAFPGPSS